MNVHQKRKEKKMFETALVVLAVVLAFVVVRLAKKFGINLIPSG